jgi:hypothetical protein
MTFNKSFRATNTWRPPLPVFSLPKTVSILLPGGKIFLQSKLPVNNKKADSISMVTGGPETEKISIVKVIFCTLDSPNIVLH